MTKWNLKNASEKEKEIYRQEFEKVYQKELQRRTPVVPASKSVSVDTAKTNAQKQSRAAVKSGGPVLMPMAQKERQREAQQRTAQQFQQFGMDPTAIVGQQIGQWAGDVLHRKAAETGIDPGKSKAAYIAEKTLGGAATSVEGTYNNILDNARAQVNAQLTNGYVTDTGVNLRDMQNFWAAVFGGKHAQYAQDTQAADKAVAEQLPAAADRLRSTKAAEYAQGLDEKYGATGLWKVGGDVASGIGGMLPSIGVNAVTGGTLGLPYIMSSAAGNAAAQARAYGADEDTALVYGLLSGATEGATEKIVGGIPGLGGGWMDKAIQCVAGSSAGRRAVKRLADVFGEGLEEALSELIGSQLEKMYLNREDWRSGGEILQDTAYSMLLGALTSAAMNAPGDIRTRRTGAKINALGGANDVISEGLRAPADGDMDGNADRLSLAAELARRATDGAKLSNADLGELYQMNARTGQQLFTLPMLEQRADQRAELEDQRAAEAEAAQDAKKDAANAIKTDSVTGEPASIGGATTSLDNIVPQSGENATDGGRFLPPMGGDAAQSGARRNAEADTPGVILPPMKGMPDMATATGDGLQLNANAENPGTAAGNEKSKRIQNRRENAFVDRVGDALSVPKGARREYLKPLADAMAAEIKQNGGVSETTASEVFNAAYDRGIVVMDEYYNQYKDLKDELRGNALTLDSESRSSREYKDMRTQYFGDLKLTNEGGTPIDVKYAELAERYPELFDAELSAPLDQLERIGEVARSIRKTGVELDAYYGDDAADFKAYARNGFDDAVEQLTRDVKGVQRYEADQAAQRQAREQKTSVPAPVSTDALKAAYETAKRLRRQADKITANELLTEQDSRTVDKLLRGDIDPEDVKGENRGGILRVYDAKKAVQDSLAPVKEYNAQRRAGLASEAAQDIAKSDAWKDKPGGLFYSTETMERNMRDIVPDRTEARALTEKYFTPVHANEAKATRWKNEQRARIAALNLTQAESEYLQVYGELQGAEAAAAMGNKRSEAELELLSQTAEEMRKKYGSQLDMDKINRGLELFRKEYDAIFEQMNEAYMRNGYAPVEYRSGYFPHFTDSQPDGLLSRIAEKLGWNTRKDELPTDIAGLTYTFRPGRKYNPNAKQRTGFETTYDALKGFDRYIETAADVIFHTEDIQRLRALEDAVRFKNSEKGIKQEVQDIRADESLTEEQRESRVAELYSKGKSHLSHFVQELNEYTNKLAGKKSIHDRGVEADAGRGIYQMMSNLENRVAANMVAVNPGSWLTNFIPITQASAECSTGSLVRAARETAKAYYKDDGFADTSVFLTNRRGSSPLSMTKLQKLSETLTKPMAYIDDFTSNVVTRAKYYDNIKAGMDASSAMQEADRYAASLMADRSKGALPTVFERKNPLTRLLTMYQVEVNNQLRHLFKDLPDDLKEKGMAALVAGLMKYTIGAYLFNDLYEKLVGRRPALDFLGIANEAIGDYTGYQLPNTVDAAQQLISGEGVDFTTQRKGAVQATASLAENVAQELPFVGGVLGGGRVPISSALPDMGNLVSNAVGLASGEKDAGRALQGIGKELAKPAFYIFPPLGGGQLKKAFEGITTVVNGGQFGYDSQGRETMKFPVENPTLGTYAQAALFGPYSLPMAQDYVDSGFRAKSAKYTEAYRAATGAGVEGEKFRAMMDAMDADGNGTLSVGEVTQGLEGHGLTPEQKAAVWQIYASDEAKAKYKAAQAVGAGDQYILMLPMLDADKNGSVSTDELYAAMDSQGLDAGQQAALWYAYAGSGQRMKYEKAEEYGLGRIYAEMLRYADTNNSGTLNKDELRAYLDSTGLNRAQKAVLFELASTAKNPYE